MRKTLWVVGLVGTIVFSGCSNYKDINNTQEIEVQKLKDINSIDYLKLIDNATNSGSIDEVNRVYAKLSINNLEDTDRKTLEKSVLNFYESKIQETLNDYNITSDDKEIDKLEVMFNSLDTLEIANDIKPVNKIERLQESKQWFRKGKEFEADGQYDVAIRCYARMSEEDYNYGEALGRTEKCKEVYFKNSVDKIDEYIKDWEFSSALKLARDLQLIDSELAVNIIEDTQVKIDKYFNEDVTYMIKDSLNKNDYVKLFKLLDMCNEYYKDNAELREFRNQAWGIKEQNERLVVMAIYDYTRLVKHSDINNVLLESLYNYDSQDSNFNNIKDMIDNARLVLGQYSDIIRNNYIITSETKKYINEFDELHSVNMKMLYKLQEFMSDAERIVNDINSFSDTVGDLLVDYYDSNSIKQDIENIEDKASEIYSNIDQNLIAEYINTP